MSRTIALAAAAIFMCPGVATISTHQDTHQIPKVCYAHEVPILQQKFGEHNVSFEFDPSQPAVESTIDAERERLEITYGKNGDSATGRGTWYTEAYSATSTRLQEQLEKAYAAFEPIREEWEAANPGVTKGSGLGNNDELQAANAAAADAELAATKSQLESVKAISDAQAAELDKANQALRDQKAEADRLAADAKAKADEAVAAKDKELADLKAQLAAANTAVKKGAGKLLPDGGGNQA